MSFVASSWSGWLGLGRAGSGWLGATPDGGRVAASDPRCCTKGFANVRRDHHGVGHVGRAAGRVAGRGAAEAVGPRAPAAVRRGAAAVGAGGRARLASDRGLHVRPFRPHIYRRARDQYQLGNRGRHVAGKMRSRRRTEAFYLFYCFALVDVCYVLGSLSFGTA